MSAQPAEEGWTLGRKNEEDWQALMQPGGQDLLLHKNETFRAEGRIECAPVCVYFCNVHTGL